MFEAPYDRDRDYDIVFENIIKEVGRTLGTKDDDFLEMCIGTTGTGKSNLMMHAYELLDPEHCTVDAIGLDRVTHAQALKAATTLKGIRFCANDEANVNKRDALTRYNKMLIDLYMAIRGLQIFHWWNNPSVDMLDKVFVEERIKGLIFIVTKDKDRPRVYYYFTKDGLLRLFEKTKGKLTMKTLKKYAKEYAYYKGWFRAYTGKLSADYLKKKEARMVDKVEDFFKEFGQEDISTQADMAKTFGVDPSTVLRKKQELIKNGWLVEGEDYTTNTQGKAFFTQTGKVKIEEGLKGSKKYAQTI